MNGGVVLTDLADAPKPSANCQDITVSLGDNGMYTIDPISIDNASNGPCFIANYEVTPAKLNCDNVGTTTVTLKVTDFKGYSSTCEAQVTVNPSSFCDNDGTYCSFTQGFYGNYGGKQFGQTTAEIILAALSNPDGSNNPITIGGGDRTIVLNQSAVDCIIEYMPAGGKPDALPIVNVNLDDQCDVNGLPTKNNNFRNVLLGQTIALSLNVRYDVQLGGLQLSEVCGADFGLNKILPNNPTIGNILELANKALAGEIDAKYISKINNAASFINEHFDECQKACGNQGRTAILDLMATPKGLSVDLTFISETNGNIISFEIEKSLDGENFQTFKEIQNIQNAEGIRSFDEVDENL
ncbi:MAG: hypothetical protein R2769_11255 [Saprospiraceae bacterium]